MLLHHKTAVGIAALSLVLAGCPLVTVGEQPRGPSHGACSGDGWCWVNPTPRGNLISAIWTSGPDDAWFVGGTGADNGTVLRWTNGAIIDVGRPKLPGLTGIWADSTKNIWCSAVDGSVVHYDG